MMIPNYQKYIRIMHNNNDNNFWVLQNTIGIAKIFKILNIKTLQYLYT